MVDDHSSDRTAEFIYQLDIPNLKLVQLSASQTGKKAAIAEGISKASGTLIITTDADCEMGEKWLPSIVSFYDTYKPKMIIAPVLTKEGKNFQQSMQVQELMALTACACGSVYYNLPILCSGANLAYEKDAFLSVNAFDGVDKTATGDDVFLMIKFHQQFSNEIRYIKSKEAVVFTHPEGSPAEALNQRKRWASKNLSYGFNHVTWVAAFIFFTNFLIFLSGIMSVINSKFALIFLLDKICDCIFFILEYVHLFFSVHTGFFKYIYFAVFPVKTR